MSLSEKTKKYRYMHGKNQITIGINGDFRHISGIFIKFGRGHILSIVYNNLCAKNQKKRMMKSRENAKKKRFFRHIFGKKLFSKIGLRHILGIAILHLCAKN